jgi:hypothetical protein
LLKIGAFQRVENAQKPAGRVFCLKYRKKSPKNPSFPHFFPLQDIRLSRIIGLTKEEIEHFRTVLFIETFRFRRVNVQFSSKSKEDIGEVLHG